MFCGIFMDTTINCKCMLSASVNEYDIFSPPDAKSSIAI